MRPIRVVAGVLPPLEAPLRRYLEAQPELTLVGCARDGGELPALVQATAPAVLVVELVLPGLDALGVLRQLRDQPLGDGPRVLVLSPVGRDDLVRTLLDAGADYCLLKPVSLDLLGDRIRQLAAASPAAKAPPALPPDGAAGRMTLPAGGGDRVRELLIALGVPVRTSGFRYLARAIDLVAQDESRLTGVTKILYPGLAREFGSTGSRVERAIRHAVGVAWTRGDERRLQELFGRRRPANVEFIACLADRVRQAGSVVHQPSGGGRGQ